MYVNDPGKQLECQTHIVIQEKQKWEKSLENGLVILKIWSHVWSQLDFYITWIAIVQRSHRPDVMTEQLSSCALAVVRSGP